jgi:hypothetical protein
VCILKIELTEVKSMCVYTLDECSHP